VRYTLRSLRHRNYRLYFLGQLVSLAGTWMQSLAQAWLIYRLTGSGLMLGLIGAMSMVPNLIFGLYGGVLADRLPRQNLLKIAQVLGLLQAVVLAALTLAGWVVPWHILVLALLLGFVQAFELPARHSFLAQLVPRNDLGNAIALNAGMFHMARFIGPAIAGVLVAVVGEGWVFLFNALTFIVALATLTAIRLPEAAEGGPHTTAKGLRAGFEYAARHPAVRGGLLMMAAISLLASSATVLMPIFAAEVFGSGARSLGWLLGAVGAGAFIGAMVLAGRRDAAGLERIIAFAGLGVGLGLFAFSFTKTLAIALLILPLIGFCVTSVMISTNSFIQLSVEDNLRGRVMALFSIALHGMLPAGHLIAGASADAIGAPHTVTAAAVMLLIGAIFIGRPLRAEAARRQTHE